MAHGRARPGRLRRAVRPRGPRRAVQRRLAAAPGQPRVPRRSAHRQLGWADPDEDDSPLLELSTALAPEALGPNHFGTWDGDHWARFVADAGALTAPARAYDRERDGSVEQWVARCVGELVVASMSELVTGCLDVRGAACLAQAQPVASRLMLYAAVATLPRGYDHAGGRGDTFSQPNMRR